MLCGKAVCAGALHGPGTGNCRSIRHRVLCDGGPRGGDPREGTEEYEARVAAGAAEAAAIADDAPPQSALPRKRLSVLWLLGPCR